MNLMRRLEKYLEANGIMKKYAAKYIGMESSNFSKMMRNESKIPPKYWESIIKLTNHAFTIQDFIEYHTYLDRKRLKTKEKKQPNDS